MDPGCRALKIALPLPGLAPFAARRLFRRRLAQWVLG